MSNGGGLPGTNAGCVGSAVPPAPGVMPSSAEVEVGWAATVVVAIALGEAGSGVPVDREPRDPGVTVGSGVRLGWVATDCGRSVGSGVGDDGKGVGVGIGDPQPTSTQANPTISPTYLILNSTALMLRRVVPF